ncbi:22657_t:CDS:2 [Cetraspora pellucida]|uniref:22657_t:CDS:1 n=1 Tax=Cetraspora pellucida TaxID=1433469 RepID=A0A9N9DNN7_9GLOM|nr:22657_t:CDS:2 [Cetraspora pellucida]
MQASLRITSNNFELEVLEYQNFHKIPNGSFIMKLTLALTIFLTLIVIAQTYPGNLFHDKRQDPAQEDRTVPTGPNPLHNKRQDLAQEDRKVPTGPNPLHNKRQDLAQEDRKVPTGSNPLHNKRQNPAQ